MKKGSRLGISAPQGSGGTANRTNGVPSTATKAVGVSAAAIFSETSVILGSGVVSTATKIAAGIGVAATVIENTFGSQRETEVEEVEE